MKINKFKLLTFGVLVLGSSFINLVAFEILSPQNAIHSDGSLNVSVVAVAIILFVWSLIGFGIAIYELAKD